MSSSTHHALSMPAPATHGLARIWNWWEAYWTRKAKRATVALLQGLDDRVLHDIGVDRSEIESVVYNTSYERRLRYEPL